MDCEKMGKGPICLLSMWLLSGIISHLAAVQVDKMPDLGNQFPVHIGAEGRMVQGRISADAEVGQLVPSNVVQEGKKDADTKLHLRVEVRHSTYRRPYLYHPDIMSNNSDPNNTKIEHPVLELINSTLPYGMEFAVIRTDAFYINKDRYLTVKDFSKLNKETRIHFDIILKDNLAESPYVSNHLPFVVEIEYPQTQGNPSPLLFVGVLVLMIVIISLLIPLGVRTKRRWRAGKPIFGCGSVSDDSDIGSEVTDFSQTGSTSVTGKDNLAMILDNGNLKRPRPSVDQHSTIQHHNVRSTSNMFFGPQAMDLLYKEENARPDFSQTKLPLPSRKLGAGLDTNKRAQRLTRSTTSRSSISDHIVSLDKNIYTENDFPDKCDLANMANGASKSATSEIPDISDELIQS